MSILDVDRELEGQNPRYNAASYVKAHDAKRQLNSAVCGARLGYGGERQERTEAPESDLDASDQDTTRIDSGQHPHSSSHWHTRRSQHPFGVDNALPETIPTSCYDRTAGIEEDGRTESACFNVGYVCASPCYTQSLIAP